MRIVYVAKHEQTCSNDDEGSIHHALEVLGHNVQRIQEGAGRRANRVPDPELLLFHKYPDAGVVNWFEGRCPRAFWYFDLVDSKDAGLKTRDDSRKAWMRLMLPNVELGFCTDGDWMEEGAAADGIDPKDVAKLRFLPQGADERIVGKGVPRCPTCWHSGGQHIDILFTGISKGGGARRESFVADMQRRWGERFVHVPKGVHREQLRDIIAASRIVVAPDFPVTNRYWSNRAWNALGFGAFLTHPACSWFSMMAPIGWVQYETRGSLHQFIEHYLDRKQDRDEVSDRGLEIVRQSHLYRHRCEQLIEEVRRLT